MYFVPRLFVQTVVLLVGAYSTVHIIHSLSQSIYSKQTSKAMESNSVNEGGFDLDAIPTSEGDVVYELGGGATITPLASIPANANLNDNDNINDNSNDNSNDTRDPIATSEECKQKGNECFKKGAYLDAIDFYTDAIEACPGLKGEDLLNLQARHEEQERERANQRYQRDSDRKVTNRNFKRSNQTNNGNDSNDGNDDQDQSKSKDEDDLAPKEFTPPSHPYGKYLAIYNSNKAASLIHLGRFSEAMTCCNIAVLADPTYPKAYIRRMTCHEQTEEIDLALRDAKKALSLSSSLSSQNRDVQTHVKRLEKKEAERMEKLKEETMGKLKDLGNSILGNFGMSLDNFKAEKDPNTGSYSIRMG